MDPPTLSHEDNRSWYLNEGSLSHACRDWPSASRIISHNIERLCREGRVAPRYIARCRELLAGGPDEMRSAFLALTDEGQVLRSIHPFAGLLPQHEREAILRRTRKRRPLDEAR